MEAEVPAMNKLCAVLVLLASPAIAQENTAHEFTVAPAYDRCEITAIGYEDGAVEVSCMVPPTRYWSFRTPDDIRSNWPGAAWANARVGDPVVCRLAEIRTSKRFYVLRRTLQDCTLLTSAGKTNASAN